jgi:ParB family transcriptional regulator, chromosome partitioning protein
MGKLEEMMRSVGGNIGESMGASRLNGTAAAPPKVAYAGMPARLQGVTKSKDAAEIALEKIAPDPNQPREEFDEGALARLADSLRARGQLQPIRVRWDEGRGMYVILVGERRWRAAGMAGLSTLSAVIVDGPMEPGELLAVQLIENCLREDLRPIEQAKAFRALMDSNGWSARQLARELAIDNSGVIRALALLDLPEAVQGHVEQGTLSPATAYEVAKLPEPTMQAEVAAAAVSEGLTRSEVAEFVQAVKAKRPAPAARPEPATFDMGDGIVVTIKWKKPSDVGAVQVLRKALKMAQARENPEQAA